MRVLASLSAIALATSPASGVLANPAEPSRASAGMRSTVDLTSGWRFSYGDQPAGVTGPAFDDSGWEQVSVPHSWNRLGEYRLTRSEATNNAQGVGWYRLAFQAPNLAAGQRVYLEFDAVGNIADVWVNGAKAGRHEGAFSRFRFDVTGLLKSGASNLIAVRADNTKPAAGSSTQHVIPLAGDFFVNGGIYRPVSLVITEGPAHIDLLDFGGPGIYAHATAITAEKADVEVLSRLRNAARSPGALAVVTRIRDADGKQVATTSQQARLVAGAVTEATSTMSVPTPRLWNGRADPYLYTVTVELLDSGRLIDSVTQPLGLRTFRMDADEGFFLNGKHLKLHGVSRHQDRQGKGWTLTDADHEEDMALIADMGANTVRGAHYQHADKWFELGDRYGMVMWAEIPFVNGVSFEGTEASAELAANARQQLNEHIRQSYNHPSIVTWSVGNEVDIGTDFAAGKPSYSLSLLKNLNELAKQADPSRPTVFADCCEDAPFGDPALRQKLAGTTDLIGYNRYYGWYYGNPAMLGKELDRFHAKHPDLPISVSEYGAGGAFTQHSDNPEGGVISAFGRPHPEEYQSWYHEESWKEIEPRSYLWASWIWNMFDFASDFRQEGEAIDLNDKGMVSYDRKRKKDAFFYYKAQWSDQPVVHITGRRYVDRAYPATDVRVYSNAPSVRLTLNGADLGSVACVEAVCSLPIARLKPGSNTLTAIGDFGGAAVSDSVSWNAPDAAATGIRIDAGELGVRSLADGRMVGSDHFFSGGEPKLLNPAPDISDLLNRTQRDQKKVNGVGELSYHDNFREGASSYAIPLPNGAWTVTVHSVEPDPAQAGKRSFDVAANGKIVAAAWSPSDSAGGALKPATLRFGASITDGFLRLKFDPKGGAPIISAIEVGR